MIALPAGVDEAVFNSLKEAYTRKNLVVFAGAGVSAGAGLPTWHGVANALVARMQATGKPADVIDEANGYLRQGNLIHALSAARLSLGAEFDHELRRQLDDKGREPPALAKAIAALAPTLCGVITTNIDRLLERALQGEWDVHVAPVADLAMRTHYVFKPHGTIGNADSWVFARDEYDRVMFGSQALQDLFGTLYHARNMLFVGASLADDDFGLTLARVRALSSRNKPEHFAILPAPVGNLRRQHLENAGIRLLVYTHKSGTHREAVDILEQLAGSTAATTAPAASPGPAAAPVPAPTAAAPAKAAVSVAASGPVDIFISAKDVALRDRLVQQFASLVAAKQVALGHEGLIRPGEDRRKARQRMFDRARFVLVLLSADYLASDEHTAEMRAALERADRGGVTVIPVLLRPCLWKVALGGRDLQPVPEKPITTFSNQDDGLFEVVEAVSRELSSPAVSR